MIEIFSTNITNKLDADTILQKIHAAFPGFEANFDLTDCDRILRVQSAHALICQSTIIAIVKQAGFIADVLPDEVPNLYHSTLTKIVS